MINQASVHFSSTDKIIPNKPHTSQSTLLEIWGDNATPEVDRKPLPDAMNPGSKKPIFEWKNTLGRIVKNFANHHSSDAGVSDD